MVQIEQNFLVMLLWSWISTDIVINNDLNGQAPDGDSLIVLKAKGYNFSIEVKNSSPRVRSRI